MGIYLTFGKEATSLFCFPDDCYLSRRRYLDARPGDLEIAQQPGKPERIPRRRFYGGDIVSGERLRCFLGIGLEIHRRAAFRVLPIVARCRARVSSGRKSKRRFIRPAFEKEIKLNLIY